MAKRKLGLQDVFAFSEILDKIDLKLDAPEMIEEAKKQDNPQDYIGGQIILMLIKNLHKAKEPIIAWVASINDLTSEEVMALGFKELFEMIKGIFDGEDMKDFFNLLSMTEQK